MAIDIENERLVRVTEAAKYIPGRPHKATVWRWVLYGVRGIRLDSIVVGTMRHTSREAVARFIAATTAVANGEPAPPVRTSRQRERAIAAAEKELAAAGI